MLHLQLFTDASVNTQSKVGYGAYLLVLAQSPIDTYKEQVKIKRFTQTSSTKLELQTLLWSLDEIKSAVDEKEISLTIYTDCQNIMGLPDRRAALEHSDYFSSSNTRLNNYQLYQRFYQLTSSIKYKLVKVLGHKRLSHKDDIERMFSLVDKASRRALRDEF